MTQEPDINMNQALDYFLRGWSAALEASHHAEFVEALRRTNKVARALARGHAVFPGDVAALDASDALLAKTELDDPASDMRDSCGDTPVSEGGKR